MASVRRRSRRSLSAMDDFTPRTLIQGFLDTAQTIRQSPRKRARVTPGPSAASPAPIPASAQRRRSRTPGTLPRSARSSRRMTRLETLATPGGSDPTPRGLITGFLQAADVQTPAIHAKPRVSSPLKQPTPSVRSRNNIQAQAESSSTSSDLPVSDVAYRFARPRRDEGPRPRRRRAIDREEFASRVRERLTQEEEEEEEEEDRMEQREEEGERETTADRVLLESIAEDPSQLSLPRPDSTTRDQGETSGLGHTPSGRRRSSRRSLLQDSSLQVPSTSTQVVHQSFLSNEGDSLMMQVSQDTVRAHSSSSADTTGDDEEEGGRQSGSASRREEGEGTVDDRMGEEDAGEGTEEEEEGPAERIGRESSRGEDEDVDEDQEDMDVRDDSREFFEDADVVAPTQPAHMESVKKKGSRASISSPLRTPHLRATGRRTTPAAKTPAAFRQAPHPTKRQPLHQTKTTMRPPPGGKGPRMPKEPPTTLPRSLMRSIFSHFSTARVSQDAIRSVEEVSSKYFKNISSDLLAYCKHAGRNTIDQADVELLMKRQRLVSDKEPLQIYIEKYLPMEYREELIPMARSGNKVYPKIAKK